MRGFPQLIPGRLKSLPRKIGVSGYFSLDLATDLQSCPRNINSHFDI